MIDTNPLQDRIARALYENAEYYGPEPTQPHWDSRDGEERGEWMKIAAAVLPIVAAEVRKAKAEALRSAAEMIEDMRNSAQIAEVAAYVPGEVGRQNVIDNFDAAMDEPGDWLRSLADSGEADTYREDRVNAWLAEAWDEGCTEGDVSAYHGVAAKPNPYRATETGDQR